MTVFKAGNLTGRPRSRRNAAHVTPHVAKAQLFSEEHGRRSSRR